MIKAIIFDFSGVCSTLEEPPFVDKFAQEHNLSKEEFMEDYLDLVYKSERDEITGEQIWEQLSDKYHFEVDIDQTIIDMIKSKEYFQDMLDFAGSLRKKGYKTAVFTNYNKIYADLMRKNIDLVPYFDEFLVSYEVKARKTEPDGFNVLLERLNVKPEETVFTDDSKSNLKAPASLGIHAIHFQSKEQLIEELKKLNVQL